MSGPLLAEFGDPDALLGRRARVRRDGHQLLDALTPFPLPEIDEVLDIQSSRIRLAMLHCRFRHGRLRLFGCNGTVRWSTIRSTSAGGRSTAWPVFLLVPFEVGMLAAALAGFIAFLVGCGLPRLHHPVFDADGLRTRDAGPVFSFSLEQAAGTPPNALRHLLEGSGATVVTEVRP